MQSRALRLSSVLIVEYKALATPGHGRQGWSIQDWGWDSTWTTGHLEPGRWHPLVVAVGKREGEMALEG